MTYGTRSKALLAALVVLGSLTAHGLVAANAAGRAPRTETGPYIAGGVQGVVGVSSGVQESVGAVHLSGGKERWVTVTVEDSTGQPVAAEVAQNLDADESPEVSHMICGSTPTAVKVKPRVEVIVYLYVGTCGSGVSVPTSGSVTAQFSATR